MTRSRQACERATRPPVRFVRRPEKSSGPKEVESTHGRNSSATRSMNEELARLSTMTAPVSFSAVETSSPLVDAGRCLTLTGWTSCQFAMLELESLVNRWAVREQPLLQMNYL